MLNHSTTAPKLNIRPVSLSDLPAIDRIQRACYAPDLHEPVDAFAAKLRLSPDSNWLAEQGDEVVGYFFTHPWSGDEPPPLGELLQQLPDVADTHFLHDLAVHPRARGVGVAPQLIETALSWGRRRGLQRSRLVAISGAAPFWQRWGFHPVALVSGYGDSAAIMALHDSPPK
jgi:GNAT superfamily N-acetyltransferase